ncbi:MAG: hypothetical protein U0326_17420 [Polyangiales bacterium]
MYYMLSCFGPADDDRASLGDLPPTAEHDWLRGARFETSPREPLEITLDPASPGVLVPMFAGGVVLFSELMLRALLDCGVDNLEWYDVALVDPASGARHTHYKAVNVIGAVRCADLARSQYTAYGEALVDTDFDSLTIDPARALGLKMFRLAECVTGVVVHESVKRHLEAIPELRLLEFVPPDQWIG